MKPLLVELYPPCSWTRPRHSADASPDDNIGCSKGLRSNSVTGSLAPRQGRPRCRPRRAYTRFIHPGAQSEWKLSCRFGYFRGPATAFTVLAGGAIFGLSLPTSSCAATSRAVGRVCRCHSGPAAALMPGVRGAPRRRLPLLDRSGRTSEPLFIEADRACRGRRREGR